MTPLPIHATKPTRQVKSASPVFGLFPASHARATNDPADPEIGDPVADLFNQMVCPPEGGQVFGALITLIAKARLHGPEASQGIRAKAIEILSDPSNYAYQRWQCCFLVAAIGGPGGENQEPTYSKLMVTW